MKVYLIEESLFFLQYKFHKQKILFHRASMKYYEEKLVKKGYQVEYIASNNPLSDTRKLIPYLIQQNIRQLHIIDPADNWLESRIRKYEHQVNMQWHESPLFINIHSDLEGFFDPKKKKYFQTSFYKEQRAKRNILIDNGQPVGGQWTFDGDNRKKYPKNKKAPAISFPNPNSYIKEAKQYVETYFASNLGEITDFQIYPVTHQDAEIWFENFLKERFMEFGPYEDAIVKEEHFLHHSLLSPLMNVGLLQADRVIEKTIKFAHSNEVPINSLEGFVRQLLGWREFIRGVYLVKGTEERNRNFWQHTRKIPSSFYTGTTGIPPIDMTILKVLKTGYAHHIERLMLLSNFMLLCEFDPDEVYRWFMELFIDAYDWVMVPNVYGMSLFADGGIMSTKPYISSSNYIIKMSNYPKGDWQMTWDGLFWRFMDKHREFMSKNPRLNMLIKNFDKMDNSKKENLLNQANQFLNQLNS
ncbi:deoxyribodipyrimidine photolyase-related protein [Aureibacter tunicatorum]|uniref:Deoxyribodipyrimidine photolyase-related protein n=2 Tax=Aureibacter tunicatorum TaxID=866807 RepID=A0AAE4BPC8_9BACT|nr:deoxyribodipyrimidine photolyase-related protein [Aureibacter tunicatorum]